MSISTIIDSFCGKSIGTGYYSEVFHLKGDNTKVVKLGDVRKVDYEDADGTREYLKAIHEGRIKEEFTPEIYEFIDLSMFQAPRSRQRPYLCVMKKYTEYQSGSERRPNEYNNKLKSIAYKLGIKGTMIDTHRHNVMMDGLKMIVTDPFAYGHREPRTTMLLNKRVKLVSSNNSFKTEQVCSKVRS
jgi:hypothetical protein